MTLSPSKRSEGRYRNHLNEKNIPILPTGTGERYRQTITNVKQRSGVHLNSPYQRKCWAISGIPLYQSLLILMIDIEGPTKIVHHFAYRWNSHRDKGPARHIINMVWLYHSLIPVGGMGVFHLTKWFLPAFADPRGGGWGGGQHPVVCGHIYLGILTSPMQMTRTKGIQM